MKKCEDCRQETERSKIWWIGNTALNLCRYCWKVRYDAAPKKQTALTSSLPRHLRPADGPSSRSQAPGHRNSKKYKGFI